MRRLVVSTLVLALVSGLFNAPVLSAGLEKQFTPSIPSYEKLDPEVTANAAAKGATAKGKEFDNHGKSYKSPNGNPGPLTPLDVRGFGKKGIAILVDFPEPNGASEVPGVTYDRIPAATFNDLLNGDVYNPYEVPLFSWLSSYRGTPAPTDRTLKNYFDQVSYDQFGITVDVAGWYTLPHSYDYYLGQNKGYYNANGDAHIGELVKDAIALADQAGVNFADYAVPARPGDFDELDGNDTTFVQEGVTLDKVVPNIFIIHRGSGAEYNLDPSIIWSHKWSILSASYFGEYYQTGVLPDVNALRYTVVDGVVVNVYNVVPEVGQDITGYYYGTPIPPSPAYVGTYAHEFSHVLGLPDQYDYGYDSAGTGMFSLMASGSWGRDIQSRFYSGNSPVLMDAWSRYYLGFASVKNVTANQAITLAPATSCPDVYKILVPGSDGSEYYLLENRQQVSFDRGLAYSQGGTALHGLVVYHVDENVFQRNFSRPNEAANWDPNNRGWGQIRRFIDPDTGESHYAIGVEQADGLWDMEHNVNDGDAGDVFPGNGGVAVLGSGVKSRPNTIPWMQWAPGIESGIKLHDIVEKPDGTVTLKVSLGK